LRWTAALSQFWQGQLERIKRKLEPGIPKSRKGIEDLPKRLDKDFWDDENHLLLAELQSLLSEQSSAAGEQFAEWVETQYNIGVDWTLINTRAVGWAQKYGFDLVRGINRTTKESLQRHVSEWVGTEGATMGDLFTKLEGLPAFNARRARMVGVTEVTRAFAEGNRLGAREFEDEGLFTWRRTWRTNNDDIVCLLCGPLHNATAQGLDGAYPDGSDKPPRHPNCRCWETYAPVVEGLEVGADDYGIQGLTNDQSSIVRDAQGGMRRRYSGSAADLPFRESGEASAIARLRGGYIEVNADLFNETALDTSNADRIRRTARRIEALQKDLSTYRDVMSEEQIAQANQDIATLRARVQEYGRRVNWSAAESLEDIITHEYGHAIEADLQAGEFEDIKEFLSPSQLAEHGIKWEDTLAYKLEQYARASGDTISEYAMKNGEEYFAESFVRYTQGRGDEIHPELKAVFDKVIK
jgi:hypothetical protein